MPLCNECDAFFRNTLGPLRRCGHFLPGTDPLTHLRIAQIVESAITCDICALLKLCSKRAFQRFLEDDQDRTFLKFMEKHFPDGPISLSLIRGYVPGGRDPVLRSRAILVQFLQPSSGLFEHVHASKHTNLNIWTRKVIPSSMDDGVCSVPPVRHDGSADSYRFIQTQLANCLENHRDNQCCKTMFGGAIDQIAGSALPTRVIAVMEGEAYIKLVETNGQQGRYVALSHCWGPQNKQPIRTLQKNLQQHLFGISLTELPRTFKEAVEVTRSVGISYLWIDSLCIVQDDENEWKTEAKKMGALYEMAVFTIAATSATNASEGLFLAGRQCTDPIVEVPIYPDSEESRDTIFVSTGTHEYSYRETSPLDRRAWAFQERHLSRRILHCTASGLLWSCKSAESFRNPIMIDERGFRYSQKLVVQNLCIWPRVVEEYTKCLLTYQSDILSAVEGIATQLGKMMADVYHMGIWMNQLPSSLLWLRPYDTSDDYQPQIPSWSWASLSGAKYFLQNATEWFTDWDKRVLLDVGSRYVMSYWVIARTEAGADGSLIVQSYLRIAASDKDRMKSFDSKPIYRRPYAVDKADPCVAGFFLYVPSEFLENGAHDILDDGGRTIGLAAFDVAFTTDFYCLFLCHGDFQQTTSYYGDRESHDELYDDWFDDCGSHNTHFQYVLLLEKTTKPSTFRRIGLGIMYLQTWFERETVQRIQLV